MSCLAEQDPRYRSHFQIISLFLLFFLIILTGCEGGEEMKMLKTSDGKTISYAEYSAETGKGVILLHRLGRSKETWEPFAKDLNSEGYYVIAIDLRGHGESEGDWRKFEESDFRAMKHDVKSAYDYLKEKRIMKISVIGESIGANTAINFGAENDVNLVVALSPSFNYKGIMTEGSAKRIKTAVLSAVSKEDVQSYSDTLKLNELYSGEKDLLIYENKGHGTNMFQGTNLKEKIREWVKKTSE